MTEMLNKFLYVAVGTLLFLTPVALIFAQDSATMSAPVVKNADGQVVFTTRLQNFVPGSEYRVGIGGVGNSAPDATIEVEIGDSGLSKPTTDFTQGFTSHWWGVDELKSRGVALGASDLPEKGKELTLRVKLMREAADNFEKLYLFVSRDYGGSTWYLEDGVELDQSYW